jgi:signal transduction histidine kinase
MAHRDADRIGLEVERGMKTGADFLTKMSHDFRTPLNIIIGFTELMLDEVPGKINEEQRSALNDILNSAKRLLELVNNNLK